jgi:long-chain acyl-CoA synthetase
MCHASQYTVGSYKSREKFKNPIFLGLFNGMGRHLKGVLRARKLKTPVNRGERRASLVYPRNSCKTLDPDNWEVPAGQTGELVASGKNIMLGYWKDPVTTATALDENGYHTGDQGYMDKDGFLFIKGRKDSLLKVGGHRINPQEIEDAVMETDLVVESAVIGVKDDLLGNKLFALVTPRNKDIDASMILSKCSHLLPKYIMPSEIKLVKMLPKNANGKIDKNKCAEIIKSDISH